MLTKYFDLGIVRRTLRFNKGATMVVTSSTGVESTLDMSELAGLDNISATELDYLDGALSTNLVAEKAAVLGTGGALTLGGALTAVTSIGIGSAVLTEAEMEMLDTLTAGTAVANKAAVLGANKNLDILAIADGGLSLGAGAGTAITATAAELNYNDITTLGTGAASKAVVLDAGEDYTWPDTGVLTIGVLATASEAAEHGAGAIGTAAVPTTKRWIERGGIIVTQTTFDLTGLASGGTANDVVGLAAGGAAYIGRNVVATNGVIFKMELSCLETPVTGDGDIDIIADTSAALIGDGAYTGAIKINGGTLVIGQTVQNLVPAVTDNYYFYIAAVGAGGGTYTAGMYVLTTYGHAVLA